MVGGWYLATSDQRLLNVLREIEGNISEVLTNRELSVVANIAINSFTRLFKDEIGISPQQLSGREEFRNQAYYSITQLNPWMKSHVFQDFVTGSIFQGFFKN